MIRDLVNLNPGEMSLVAAIDCKKNDQLIKASDTALKLMSQAVKSF